MAYAIPFDTLAFAKELETAGVPPAQAEAQAKVLSDTLQKVEDARRTDLATKGDILMIQRDIKDLEARLEAKIEASRVATIQWTSGMFAAQTALIIGAMFAMLKLNQPNPPPIPYHAPPAQEMRLPSPSPQEMRQQPPQEMRLPVPAQPGR